MDLSIDNIKLKKGNIHFKGLEGAYDTNSVPVFKFLAPPHKQDEDVYLQIAIVDKDENMQYIAPKEVSNLKFDGTDIIELPQEAIKQASESTGLAYRFKLVDKNGEIRYEIDPFKSIKVNGSQRMNVIEQGRGIYGISPKGGTMRHSMLDSDVKVTLQNTIESNSNFIRNHFNKLGGNLNGLYYLLTQTDELDNYTYIMTTPDIGVDKISSHRYWPSNHYQCSDISTFKKFNFEMFKRGKNYVADGAFTSQGLQSPLVQHVLKWGEASPFYHWLKISGRPALGVLPDVSYVDYPEDNPYEHIGVRVVNSKYDSNYQKNKPTYIQFYDDRLLSEEKQKDGLLHYDNDISPDDIFAISNHQDSVQPYAFEVDPNDKKLKVFKDKKAVLLKDIKNITDFLSFPNFDITYKNRSGCATCWDGNVDIIKMNLSNPTNIAANKRGCKEAREYLFGVGEYWTDMIFSNLILETAKLPSRDVDKIALNNQISTDRLKAIKESVKNGKFNSVVLKEAGDKYSEELIKKFPLQTLETSDELSAIFAQPAFQKELFSDKTYSRIKGIFDSAIDDIIPKDYKTDKEYRAYIVKTYGYDILKTIFAYALNPKSVNEDGTVNLTELGNVTLKSLERYYSSDPNEERKQVVNKIVNGLSANSVQYLVKKAKAEAQKISLEQFKTAEAVVIQGKGGLCWRFDAAKDVGDLDAVRDKTKAFGQIWNGDALNGGVQDFWAEFVARIRKHNLPAYVINEVTTLNEFCPGDDYNSYKAMKNFDKPLAEAYNKLDVSEKRYERHPIYAKQVQFLDLTNSTTTSEFAKGFNAFSKFAGVDPENGSDVSRNVGRLGALKGAMEELMEFNQPNSAMFSHMFSNNHDKPSVLHTLPLDMSIFLAQDLKSLPDQKKNILKGLVEAEDKVDEICPKAAAVAFAYLRVIDKLYAKDKTTAKALKEALGLMVTGRKKKGARKSYKRAEDFATKPFEKTIPYMFKIAGIKDPENEKALNFRFELMKNAMNRYEKLWQVMNACVGVPTLYGGNEFASTGYETSSKNTYVAIRNEVEHNLKEVGGFKEYYKKICATSGLSKNPELRALRDGFPTSLEMTAYKDSNLDELRSSFDVNEGAVDYFTLQIKKYLKNNPEYNADSLIDKLNKLATEDSNGFSKFVSDNLKIDSSNGNHVSLKKIISKYADNYKTLLKTGSGVFEMWPIYKQNTSGSKVVSVVTNLGLPTDLPAFETNGETPQPIAKSVKSISIKDKNGKCPLADDTILKKYGDNTNTTYIVQNKAIVRQDKRDILLTDTVSTFYVPSKKNTAANVRMR